MSKQPTALYLAEILQSEPGAVADAASAELRRLHTLNGELLEALKSTRAFVNSVAPHGGLFERINAAIARAEGAPNERP
jgi:hypothetical protein